MSNESFKKKVSWVRRKMPFLSLFATLLSYSVAAIVTGYLLDFKINNPLISYGIAVAAQVVRMVIVFFGQLNPKTPDFGYLREGIAAVFGAFTVYEIWGLGSLVGWEDEIKLSLTILIIGGAAIEIMLLQSIKTFNRMEIMSDPDTLAGIQNAAKQTALYKMFMAKVSKIENGEGDIADLEAINTNAENKEIARLQSIADKAAGDRQRVEAANKTMQDDVKRAEMQAEESLEIARKAVSASKDVQATAERLKREAAAERLRLINEVEETRTRMLEQMNEAVMKARQEEADRIATLPRELTMEEAVAIADEEEAEALERDRKWKESQDLEEAVAEVTNNVSGEIIANRRPSLPSPAAETDEQHAARIARNRGDDEQTFDLVVNRKNGSPTRKPASAGIEFDFDEGK